MKKILALLLSVTMALGLTACLDDSTDALLGELVNDALDALEATDTYDTDEAPDTWYGETEESWYDTTQSTNTSDLDPEGWYYSAEDVSEYLYTYGCLPENFITKSEAREMGWEGGSVEVYAPGCAIGGDVFGNREGLLPEEGDRVYYECDIDTNGQSSRGAKRLVYSNDGLIYYTEDHYETFVLLYGEE